MSNVSYERFVALHDVASNTHKRKKTHKLKLKLKQSQFVLYPIAASDERFSVSVNI
jgi:hypothetical protein